MSRKKKDAIENEVKTSKVRYRITNISNIFLPVDLEEVKKCGLVSGESVIVCCLSDYLIQMSTLNKCYLKIEMLYD